MLFFLLLRLPSRMTRAPSLNGLFDPLQEIALLHIEPLVHSEEGCMTMFHEWCLMCYVQHDRINLGAVFTSREDR